MVKCNVCKKNVDIKYKCPSCFIKYCSQECYNNHRDECNSNSNNRNGEQSEIVPDKTDNRRTSRITSRSLVPLEKLETLREKTALMDLLRNPHLCNLLKTINESEDPEGIMQKAMQEPLFTEFADVCLGILDPPSDDER